MLARLRQRYSVLRFILIYRTHLDKHKTLNVGTLRRQFSVFTFMLIIIQDVSRQAQNSKCWPAADTQKLYFGDIAEEIYIKKWSAAGGKFWVFFAPFTFGNVFFLRISSISGGKILNISRLRWTFYKENYWFSLKPSVFRLGPKNCDLRP